MAAQPGNSEQTSPANPGTLTLCLVAGATLGLLPAAACGRLLLYLPAALIVLGVYAFAEYSRAPNRQRMVRRVGTRELLSGMLSACFGFAVAGVLALVAALVVGLLIAWLDLAVLPRFAPAGQLPVDAWARWSGLIFGLCCTFGMGLAGTDSLLNHLYPPLPASGSVFKPDDPQERKRLSGCLYLIGSLLLVGVVGSALREGMLLYWVFVQSIVLFGTAHYYRSQQEMDAFLAQAGATAGAQAVSAVAKLLQFAGFATKPVPGTNDPGVASVLRGIDLIAERSDRVLVVQIKVLPEDAAPLEWTAGAGLQSASLAYADAFASGRVVEALMVLCGGKPAANLVAFAESQALLTVVPLETRQLGQILAAGRPEDLVGVSFNIERLLLPAPQEAATG